MRASVLSSDTIIDLVNENFIPYALNVTTDGFPSAIPALKHYQGAYKSNWR